MKIAIRLLKELKQVWGIFTVGIILLLVVTAGLQIAPLYIQEAIDTVLTPMTQGASLDSQKLIDLLALFMVMTVIVNILGYFAVRLLMHCANVIGANLRNRAYDVMQNLPVSYFDDKPAGKIASRIVNDTENIRSYFYGTVVTQVIVNTLQIIGIYIVLFYLNSLLACIMLLLIPLYYVWQQEYGKRTEKDMADYYELRGEMNSQVNETMSGSTIIQLFKQEEKVMQQFDKTTQGLYDAQQGLIKVEASISWGLIEVMKRMAFFVILAVIGSQFLSQTLTISIGVLFSYINYIDRLFMNMGGLVRLFPNLQRSLATGKRVLELLDEPLEADSQLRLQTTDGDVRFENVTFSYKEGTPVLKNINIHARRGQTVALVGHTGSGKSSIMNLLFRFYDPQEGAIYIDGQRIQEYNRESVRADMGIVLQDPYLFTGTIATNVAMDDSEMSRETIEDALIKVGARDMLARLEKGIDEPVVEKGETFSSGERQLIAFARTLASDPKILILDEATSHIDTETEDIIQRAMAVVKEGRTTFIIAHRLSTIQNADQILVLHEGEIVESGTHETLLAQNGKYAGMYRMQQKI